MADLRVGVIGSGGRGGLARHAHKPGAGSRVVACCDVSDKVLAANREWYGPKVFVTKDPRQLLKRKLDAVFVCTPDFLHEEHALLALEAASGVYLEKPMAITIAGCDRILLKAKEKRARLFVGHNMRYMNIIRKMKQLIVGGAIGEVKSVWCRHFISYGGDAYFRDWHSERRYSTGLLLQKAAHDLDVIHWLANAYTQRVAAFGNLAVYDKLPRRRPEEKGEPAFNPVHWPPLKQRGFSPAIDVEDQSMVILTMERGILGAYLQCHFTPDACRNYTVIGTAGRLENLGDGPDSPIFVWNKRTDSYNIIGDEVHRGEDVAGGGHGGADPLIVREFLQFVRKGGKTTATPEAARMSVATGCQATASLRNGGQPLDVPPVPIEARPRGARVARTAIQDSYDAKAATYDQPGNPLIPVEQMAVASLLRHLSFTDVLDAACGTGRWALRLAAEGKRVVGVDVSPGMLALARRKAKEQKLSAVFREEPVTRLSAPDRSFDLVICALALAHVPKLGAAVRELARVARPGGHVIISDVHPDIQAYWGPGCKATIAGAERAFPAYHGTVDKYVKAVQGAGLELLSAIDVPMQQSMRGLATGALVVLARKPPA